MIRTPAFKYPKYPSGHSILRTDLLLPPLAPVLVPNPETEMAEKPASDPQNPREEYPDSASSAPELRLEAFHGGNGDEDRKGERPALRALSSVGSNAARYKSMSPARLPISRSPCLTIPPGLSPTTLLDSPVLLPNPKAEPSPTTGIFSRPPATHDGVNSDFFSSRRDTPYDNRRDEGSSSKFEFKPHTNSSSNSNLSSLGHLANSSSNYQQLKQLEEIQGQYQSQKFAFSTSIAENVKLSSDDFTRSLPASVPQVHMVTSRASASSEASPNELRQRQGSDGSIQPMHSDNIDHNGYNPPVVVDKSLEDGYGWRKYGQKHVKGSEFPRSYYKCTHPNCQVKKQLERSHDGHITEVIYKGSHDHPKPLPGRRSVLCANLSSQTEERCDGFSSLISTDVKLINGHGQQSHQIEENGGSELSPASVNEDDTGACVQPNKIGDVDDDDDEADDPDSKRRKRETGGIDITPTISATREPRVVVQTLSEVDILDDGYRWRKYGQKVVKGNPNPRSYYKCTNAGCPVRKHVERASHDPKAVITTYEGKHNHDVPSARTSSHAVAGPKIPNDSSSVTCNRPSALNMFKTDDTMKGMLRCFDRQDQPGIVSLDLGVGINLSSENRSNGNQQTPDTKQAHTQIEMTGCDSGKMIQATPVSTYYGSSLKEGVDCYGPRNASLDSFSFKTQPINHPTDTFRQNMGRLVMGP